MKCFSLQVAPRCLLTQVTMDTEVHNVSGCRYITGDRKHYPVDKARGESLGEMSYLVLLPKSCVVTIIDERKWPSGREELGTSWIITVGVDSIAPTDKCMFQHIIIQWILKLFPLKTANKRK